MTVGARRPLGHARDRQQLGDVADGEREAVVADLAAPVLGPA